MRILWTLPYLPWPTTSGHKTRQYHLLRALAQRYVGRPLTTEDLQALLDRIDSGSAQGAAVFDTGIFSREMNWRLLWHAVVDGAAQTAVVMLLVAASALLGGYLTEQQLPQQLAKPGTTYHLSARRWTCSQQKRGAELIPAVQPLTCGNRAAAMANRPEIGFIEPPLPPACLPQSASHANRQIHGPAA